MGKHNSFIENTKEVDERLEALKQLYPEIFSDGKINLDAFKDVTGTSDLPDGQDKTPGYYGLYWPGKRAAKQLARKEAEGTLEPVVGDGVNEDTTHNIYIEGENLEVLRILKQSYKGRVKMIYIDPPYNTGKDFIYPDDYKMPVEEYLKMTGQADESGKRLSSNLKSNGAFHTNWLNMMYPRLQIARELLTEDGVIFISIDDNEQANLKLLCDDIFGEENFIACIDWKRKKEISNDSNNVAIQGEFILTYAKSDLTQLKLEPLSKEYIEQSYNEPTEEFPLDKWRPVPLTVSKGLKGGGYTYEITTPNGTKHTKLWAYPENSYKKLVDENKVYFGKDKSGIPQRVMYLFESKGQPTSNYWDNVATNKEGKKDILNMFGENIFDTPKPISLLLKMFSLILDQNDIVMDFFSGSATTAVSLFNYNIVNQTKNHFIMVQLPFELDNSTEVTAKNAIKFLNSINKSKHDICELAKERIRRAGAKILEETKANKDMFREDNPLDVGFKVYRLQKSNFEKYTPVEGQSEDSKNMLFQELENNLIPLVDGWKPENVLTEIILRQGFVLDCTKEKIDSFKNNTVWKITDATDAVSKKIKLYVCLDSAINEETIKALTLGDDEKFICLDSAIDDSSYARLSDKGRIETI